MNRLIKTKFGKNFIYGYIEPLVSNKRKIFESWGKNINLQNLRKCQKGAIYGVLSHWTISTKPGIVVMPTGTGKTETLISLILYAKLNNILIIVPSDVLRKQTYEKILELGVLKENLIINTKIKNPLVGVLYHGDSQENIKKICKNSNIIISTMKLISNLDDNSKQELINNLDYFFVDEAHHSKAETWDAFLGKAKANNKRIVKFTATPFRQDNQIIDGSIVYNYSLRKAQNDGLFKSINFLPIEAFDNTVSDSEIAEKSTQQLKNDKNSGYSHILMVRVSKISRTSEVLDHYKNIYDESKIVTIHSDLRDYKKKEILRGIKNGQYDVVICVGMLGEGFDLNMLKILAYHDKYKNLSTTLQLLGRFSRSGDEEIGNATIITNIQDKNISQSLSDLYKNNADWNYIISHKSENTIESLKIKKEFFENFESNLIEDGGEYENLSYNIKEDNFIIPSSTEVYETYSEFDFKNCATILENEGYLVNYNINENILYSLKKDKKNITWIQTKDIYDIQWSFFVMYYDKNTYKIFIYSNSESFKENIIKKFNFHQSNLGKKVLNIYEDDYIDKIKVLGRSNLSTQETTSYNSDMGKDVIKNISDLEKYLSTIKNVSASTFGGGISKILGTSCKGKVWNTEKVDLFEWKNWCVYVSSKVLGNEVSESDLPRIFQGFVNEYNLGENINYLDAERIVGIFWNEKIYSEEIKISDHDIYDYDLIIDRDNIDKDNFIIPLNIENQECTIRIKIYYDEEENKISVSYYEQHDLYIRVNDDYYDLVDWINNNPFYLRYIDNSYLDDKLYYKTGKSYVFNNNRLISWNWSGYDIKKEERNGNDNCDSVQKCVIDNLFQNNYDIIFFDHGKGEIADIIGIYISNGTINLDLYHCKTSGSGAPRNQINDLYDVCGQAQKSAIWNNINEMYTQIIYRSKNASNSKFIEGNKEEFDKIIENRKKYSLEVKYSVYVVNPMVNLSSIQGNTNQNQLLGSTEGYLKDFYGIDFYVIGS
ncbi:DEAD/DEAH box helicase [Candidatus Absconditicoccus praedator]|uniref:DEAD/DEAH box helicase n=1 Tax=Candidatus Absconditicoccus praedator TaxID=2735562 RepID=UPI001E2E6F65|nr:DEAD/DEAH box helicase family protein [Candidatus Absconditicoccus praedator]UFX83388.1 DEAD/DEAH box helicase family protein [Candidatus Absconditicoccus praedator]